MAVKYRASQAVKWPISACPHTFRAVNLGMVPKRACGLAELGGGQGAGVQEGERREAHTPIRPPFALCPSHNKVCPVLQARSGTFVIKQSIFAPPSLPQLPTHRQAPYSSRPKKSPYFFWDD